MGQDDPDTAPPTIPVFIGVECQYIGTTFAWNEPSPTSKPTWPVGATAIVWVETAALADLVAAGITKIDATANSMRAAVLTQPTNAEEYHRAADQARPFKAAGYTGAVPESVQAWADAKHRDAWTVQQATDDIVATADLWDSKLDGIRRLRLLAKEDVRHAADGSAIAVRVQQFVTDLNSLMAGLTS